MTISKGLSPQNILVCSKHLGHISSHIMEIKIGAHVQRPHSHLQMSKVHAFSENVSPVGTCTQARADFAVSSSGALVQLEKKFQLLAQI